MDGNGQITAAEQDAVRKLAVADAERERTFVEGYMSLMKCSEPAARSVYMLTEGRHADANHLLRAAQRNGS